MSEGVAGLNCRGRTVKNSMCWWAYARFMLMCVYVGEVQDKIPTGSKEGMKEGGNEGVAPARWKLF